MCYAIPGKLIEINNHVGVIDYFGEKKRALVDLSNAKVGDYVYAQGGVLINKISEKEAEEVLDAWRELFFVLKERDKQQAKIHDVNAPENLLAILQKVNIGGKLSKKEMLYLLRLNSKKELKLLYETANNLRQKSHGNSSCVHGIIEFSNWCKSGCFYCGIRKTSSVKRYRMSVRQIIDSADKGIKKLGFKALVLQSGEDRWYDEDKLVDIVNRIRKMGVLIFLSIGLRSKKTYKKLFCAGARGCLLRFETSNSDIFSRLRPETNLEERLELIKYIKNLGYVLATGFLIGLAQERDEDIINNILLTKSLKPDMYSFGPFIPTKGTPLEKYRLVNKDTILKTIAIARLLDKDSNILVTTALETLDSKLKKEGLLAGANSLMINITPSKYKGLYRIYDNRAGQNKEIKDSIKETIDLLYSLGRAPTDLGI